tara:strand:- start:457 stop:1071 length:615 start_codon:yes stop_codon:yes gene_type:complete
MVVAFLETKDNKLSNKLQKDIIKIGGKTIFLNPFLYWRRIDENTNKWLREPNQIAEAQIKSSRNRFYPEVDWETLDDKQKALKYGTIEMFLKTLQLISTFHTDLNSRQLEEVERKMSISKKYSFEKWVQQSFAKKANAQLRERRKFARIKFISRWKEWLFLEETQKALLPVIMMVFLSSFIGWSAGISQNSCNPYFEDSIKSKL